MDICTLSNSSSDSNHKRYFNVNKSLGAAKDDPSSRIQTFLRIKSTCSSNKNESHKCIYSVENSSTLLVKNYNLSSVKRQSEVCNKINKKCTFSKIFDSQVNQSQFFEEAIKPTIINFINRESSTVITYGTADSGKSYTLFGSLSDPGIIARSIKFIYESFEVTELPRYKPTQFSNIERLDESQIYLETVIKDEILSYNLSNKLVCEKTYQLIENTKFTDIAVNRDSSCSCIWISFIEIYNDNIFDLLNINEEGKKVQIKLISDKNGVTYLKGLQSVCTTSGEEALEILFTGQTRLTTYSTSSYESSRSHSVFFIKLLEYEEDSMVSDVKITSISFYDLAGPGRIKKLIYDKGQIRESRSINKSLLAFGRYFKIRSEDYSRKNIGSFRDSKLTRILQQSVHNKQKIIFLTHLNPAPELFAESQNILKFSSTKIKFVPENIRKEKVFSNNCITNTNMRAQKSRLPVAQKQKISDMLKRNKQSDSQLIESKINELKEQYESSQNNLKLKITILIERKDNLLKFSVNKVENYSKDKLEEKCLHYKSKKDDRGHYAGCLKTENLKIENLQFFNKILLLKLSLERTIHENKELNVENSRYAFQLSLLKNCLRKFSEFINKEKSYDQMNCEIFNLNAHNAEILIDHETVLHLLNIFEFIKKSLENEIKHDISEKSTHTMSISIQCDLYCKIIAEFYQDIKSVLNCTDNKLLQIDDSVQINKDTLTITDLIKVLSDLKKLIIKNDKIIRSVRRENEDQYHTIELLKNQLQHQELLLQPKIQNEKLESCIPVFSNNIQSEIKFKADNYFENTIKHQLCLENEEIEFLALERSLVDSDLQLSLCGSASQKSETVRCNSDCSKIDSGLTLSTCVTTTEISCQTISSNLNDTSLSSFEEQRLQFQQDYKQMESKYLQECVKVAEISRELKNVKKSLEIFKENSELKEQMVKKHQNELSITKLELELLNQEKQQLQRKCDELTKHLENVNSEDSKRLVPSQGGKRICEKHKGRPMYCIEKYWQKTSKLHSKSFRIYCKLDNSTTKRYKDRVFKIVNAKSQLKKHNVYENQWELRATEYTEDLSIVSELSKNVNCLSSLFEQLRKEKSHLHRLFDENWKLQEELEQYLMYLTKKLEKRDNEIFLLKSNLRVMIESNLLNNQKAKDLGKETMKLMEKMSSLKKIVAESEETRKQFEENAFKEIGSLKAQLKTTFEENTELLNIIFNKDDDKQSEVNWLKSQLLKKQKELDFFKRNRNITIQRYERLVRHLQEGIKMNSPWKPIKSYLMSKQTHFYVDEK